MVVKGDMFLEDFIECCIRNHIEGRSNLFQGLLCDKKSLKKLQAEVYRRDGSEHVGVREEYNYQTQFEVNIDREVISRHDHRFFRKISSGRFMLVLDKDRMILRFVVY